MNETEPRMRVRDADLRELVHKHGAGPGTDLHGVLAELQERRDEADGRSTKDSGPGGGRAHAAPV